MDKIMIDLKRKIENFFCVQVVFNNKQIIDTSKKYIEIIGTTDVEVDYTTYKLTERNLVIKFYSKNEGITEAESFQLFFKEFLDRYSYNSNSFSAKVVSQSSQNSLLTDEIYDSEYVVKFNVNLNIHNKLFTNKG